MGGGKKRTIKQTDIAAKWRTERPQERGRGQTKGTQLKQLLAIICDQEGGYIKICI